VIWQWINVAFKDLDEKHFRLSYVNVIKKRQYWRVLTSILTHTSVLQVIVNISCIWNLRYLEDYYGTFFMIKYSIALAISEMFLAFGMISITILGSGNNPTITNFLHNLESNGCSGLILAWLTFQSVAASYHNINPVFIFMGFLSISPSLAPLFMLIIYTLTSGRNNLYSNTGGLINGYLLSSGMLLFLTNLYWSLAFLFDVLVVIVVSVFSQRVQGDSAVDNNSRSTQSLSFRVYEGAHQEELIEIQYDLSPSTGEADRTGNGVTDGHHFRPREEYDEEALEPLLEDGTSTSSTNLTTHEDSSTFQRISSSVRRTIARARSDLSHASGNYSRVESEEQ
jgi:membrane associated rhomboid family serine protease